MNIDIAARTDELDRQIRQAVQVILDTNGDERMPAVIEQLARGSLIDQAVAAYCRLLLAEQDAA